MNTGVEANGATGLEPVTPSLSSYSRVGDARRRTARNTCIHHGFRLRDPSEPAWLRGPFPDRFGHYLATTPPCLRSAELGVSSRPTTRSSNPARPSAVRHRDVGVVPLSLDRRPGQALRRSQSSRSTPSRAGRDASLTRPATSRCIAPWSRQRALAVARSAERSTTNHLCAAPCGGSRLAALPRIGGSLAQPRDWLGCLSSN